MEAFSLAEKKLKPNPAYLFSDVYDEMPMHIEKQFNEMKTHLAEYEEHYPIDKFEKIE
jgi:2-oxoisovalerate dehydrogenase E1 component alpha subunit